MGSRFFVVGSKRGQEVKFSLYKQGLKTSK